MRWKPDLNLTTNARVFTALYVSALVMGPPIMILGAGNTSADDAAMIIALFVLLIMPLVGGYVAGRMAGPGHGIRVAVLAYFLSRSALIMDKLFWDAHLWGPHGLGLSVVEVLITSFVPCAFIMALVKKGERRSARMQTQEQPDSGRRWRVAGTILLLFMLYTWTLAGRLAVHRNDPNGIHHLEPFPAGVYAGVAPGGLDECELGPLVYTDPTGLVLIGAWDIPHCMCHDRIPPLYFLSELF